MENQELTLFIETVRFTGEDIFLKPFCDAFNIDYENQCKSAKKDTILREALSKKIDFELFGDKRERYALSPKGFIRWIQLINPNLVPAGLIDKLTFYQNYIFDYLFGSLEQKQDISIKNKRLIKLKHLYGVIGNEIQRLQKDVTTYVHDQLKLDHYTTKKLR